MKQLFSQKRIYADWAATTPLHPEVAHAMKSTRNLWANPSALYKEGVLAKQALEKARSECARILSTKPDELFFTSGGTEANNMIIRGLIGDSPQRAHIVSTTIEHSSILETLRDLEKQGVSVTYVGVNAQGIVDVDEIMKAIQSNTVLVTCMYVNNEIGTIQPVSKIGAQIRKLRAQSMSHFPVFHTDASQAPLWLACDMEGLRADALTLDAHKMQGPKGIGLLAVRRGIPFTPLLYGGGQERGKRPTTESIELVTGFVKALSLAVRDRESRCRKVQTMRDEFVRGITRELPQAIINGTLEKRIPNNINISLPHLSDPEFAVLVFDEKGIACSTKSSCLKGEEESYVIRALGGESWRARNTLRFSLDPHTSKRDVHKILSTLKTL